MKPLSWLTAADACVHLRFVDAEGKPVLHRFAAWKHRLKAQGKDVPAYRIVGTTRSLRYRQVDLDRFVEPYSPEMGSLIEGARHLRAVT